MAYSGLGLFISKSTERWGVLINILKKKLGLGMGPKGKIRKTKHLAFLE